MLTSGGLHYLNASYNSVKNQKSTTLEYDIQIIVNTTNDEYYDKVIKMYPDAIRTESNGAPGKGHNSVIDHFESCDGKYDYLMMLDGDDFMYPYALSKLEHVLNYNPDAVFLPFTDMIDTTYPDNQLSFPVKSKAYIRYNNFVPDMFELWKDTKKSPFANNIRFVNTPGRIMLLSRNALNMKIRYSETVKWYDDLYPMLQLMEYNMIDPSYKIFGLIDYDIMLYNRLNEESASSKFIKDSDRNYENEERVFRKIIKNKFLSIRDWNLNALKFLRSDVSSELSISDKYDFCSKLVEDLDLPDIDIRKDNINMFRQFAVNLGNKKLTQFYTYTSPDGGSSSS